ncbi:hypothetical protein [Bacillus sp. SM2101]|uniref:hypothetical protein n=1 Tax=Bacillus sp. SM2101 TaxID=2805366 RepID=UPI001BDE1DE2|nr:hypothetical protein [Bacillus sp. SM2101]
MAKKVKLITSEEILQNAKNAREKYNSVMSKYPNNNNERSLSEDVIEFRKTLNTLNDVLAKRA